MRTTRKTSVSATSRIEIIVMRNNDLNWWPLEGNLHCIYFDGNIFFHRIEGKEYVLSWPGYQHTEIIEISDNFSTNIGLDSTKVYACTL